MKSHPKSHVTRYSIHSLRYCSECPRPDAKYAKKILIKTFIEQNPGITRTSLKTLIKKGDVLCHRFKNTYYVCWR